MRNRRGQIVISVVKFGW